MADGVNVIGLEVVVPRISQAVEFFVDVIGFELAYRGPARDVAGEIAVVDGGSIAITLLEPATSGDGVLADRSPRVTQLVIGVAGESFDAVVERMRSSGVPTREHPDGRAFVAPAVAAGILGFDMTLMFGSLE